MTLPGDGSFIVTSDSPPPAGRNGSPDEGSGVGQGYLREMQGHQAQGGHSHRLREPEAQTASGLIVRLVRFVESRSQPVK